MTRRTLATSGVLLALAIALVQLAIWWLRPAPTPNALVGPPRSGYTLKDFTFSAYAADGQLSFRIRAPSLQRREGDQSLFIDKPRFELPPAAPGDAAPWKGQADYAWVKSDNTVVRLMGQVDMHRSATASTPIAAIHTSDVTAWPQQHRLATDRPARLRRGTSRMSGVGLRANLATKHLELLHDFHGTFEPSRTP